LYLKRSSNLIIADFGCGEARLARSVPNKVHSFDLVAINDLVVECDIKKVPLNSESCDIVVFCLSLMGTNVFDFVSEAHRVLKLKGVMKICEVVSRIEDRYNFIRKIESIGFKLVNNNNKVNLVNSF
jgi:ribosomal RNA-processing protein 8